MTTSKSILLVALAFVASISSMAADEPRRLLRLPNSDADDTNHRILQSSSMSMATESMDTVGPNMEVIDAIVSKVEKEGEEVDPAALMLANLALVEFDESAMHHHGGYGYTNKCLKLLFILLPQYKASKLSFICGETVTTSTTAACGQSGATCNSISDCCSQSKYIILLIPTLYIDLSSYNYEHFLLIPFRSFPISICALGCNVCTSTCF